MAYSCKDLASHLIHQWRTSTSAFKLVSGALLLSWVLFLSADLARFRHRSVPPQLDAAASFGRRGAPCTDSAPCRIQVIADLDAGNAILETHQHLSYLLSGSLTSQSGKWNIGWLNESMPIAVRGNLAEAGRGMELSELVMYQNMLLAFDDRTGVVYEIGVKQDLAQLRSYAKPMVSWVESNGYDFSRARMEPLPKWVILEGDGQGTAKGMKIEWACEKDGELYVGSFGKEYTDPAGDTILSSSNFWVAVINSGEIRYLDWELNYNALRMASDTMPPGYLLHEAVNWSPFLKKWVFLPRRVSKEKYSETEDEKRGSNLMLIATENFSYVDVIEIGFSNQNPYQGFSSFKFIPGTQDQIILALRSEEHGDLNTQATTLSIFDLKGNVLIENYPVSAEFKFEGVEIW